MHNTTRSLIFIALAYISTVFLSGCSEPTLVGNDLLVNGQEFVTDTAILDLVIYPEREDSIISSSVANLSATSLGIINSPYFGRIKSGFFTEILLSANGVDFGDATLDSMVLVLDYLAVLGDSTSSHDLRVYEVTEEITRDTLYNNYEFAYDSLPIGTLNGYQFNNVDDIVLGGEDTVGAQLRIPLDPIFAQKFLDENADTSSTVFNTDDDLHEWFRGLYITVDDANSSENSMAFFNTISGTVSRMVLYYTTQDTIQTAFSFQISFAANQHVRIDTDYSGSGVETLLAQNPPLNQRSVLAPMAGINSIISIPDIMDYSDKLISKAEIILPVLPLKIT